MQYPVEAKRSLTKKSVAQEFRGHLDVMHRASRDLLGTSPHFSTRRGQTDAHLQAGVRLHRTGLEFGEVEQGTPVHLQRAGHEPVPLGIGLPRTDEERAEATDRLETLARRTAWRTDEGAMPAPQELIGAPASPEVEGARLLLWAVLNPMLAAGPRLRRRPCTATAGADRDHDGAAPAPSRRRDRDHLPDLGGRRAGLDPSDPEGDARGDGGSAGGDLCGGAPQEPVHSGLRVGGPPGAALADDPVISRPVLVGPVPRRHGDSAWPVGAA
ncbi:hypothetical protein [Brachybacterium sp. GPGPB12]|uniref:hypothetical protein n=1 Tax=Brachybacterium sp. GPGPB12 TaxID=3023517 RepID=UPI003134385A